MRSNRTWQELSPAQRVLIVAGGAAELVTTTVAAVDLWRRPAKRVNGRKGLWWPLLAVQPIGPIAYLVWGRRR